MKKCTQAMLDAAKDDATLLPFDTVFVTANKENTHDDSGVKVQRKKKVGCDQDDKRSVRFAPLLPHCSEESFSYIVVKDLLPAKKSKPKKWQNGTQAQLDAAKDDARLIPKKTYFMAKRGDASDTSVFKIDNPYNDSGSVAMMNAYSGKWDFYWFDALEPVND